MNWDEHERNWIHFSSQVQERWGKLSEAQLDAIRRKREQLEARLGRTGAVEQEVVEKRAERQVDRD